MKPRDCDRWYKAGIEYLNEKNENYDVKMGLAFLIMASEEGSKEASLKISNMTGHDYFYKDEQGKLIKIKPNHEFAKNFLEKSEKQDKADPEILDKIDHSLVKIPEMVENMRKSFTDFPESHPPDPSSDTP
jgi:hypothetical protein